MYQKRHLRLLLFVCRLSPDYPPPGAQLAADVTREMGCGASRLEPQPDKASAKAPAGPAPGPPAAVESQAAQGAATVAPAAGTDKRSGKASAKAPPPSFAALIAAGTVVPDEHDGPYALSSYHRNVTGGH